MLETIKKSIYQPSVSAFSDFFRSYIMDVQDLNINIELHYLISRNNLDVGSMDILIKNTFDGLVKI